MTETVHFTTPDGVELVGDLSDATDCRAAAIVCHPHPQYGGNRFNNVVQALFDALPSAGITALRFDFRTEYDHGRGELIDAGAALDHVAAAQPGVPLIALGYSFGGAITLGIDDDRVSAKVLVAPPLAAMDIERAMDVPMLVLTPAHDQFSPPDPTLTIIAEWPTTTYETIESTDHFLHGRTALVAERAVDFLTERPI